MGIGGILEGRVAQAPKRKKKNIQTVHCMSDMAIDDKDIFFHFVVGVDLCLLRSPPVLRET